MVSSHFQTGQAVVIGAGIAGLCSAARLRAAGYQVTLIEQSRDPGGKIRAVPSKAGPVDAGPTVMTLKPVFDDVFATLGERLDDHLHIEKAPVVARHFWPDGSQLDLTHEVEANRAAIADFSDESNAEAFARFDRSTRALFQAFRGPMMEAPNPSIRSLISTVLRNPSLLGAMAPLATLDGHLARLFSDPRLVQLFGRYATYVGGSPLRSPALLGLIWQAEMEGVWHVVGGLAQLPKAVDALIRRHGVTCHYGHTVTQINCQDGAVTSVSADGLADVPADLVVFNGDPRALAKGALGPDVAITAPNTLRTPRSHSALVWSFAARPKGRALSHHNVFFSKDNAREFAELQAGQVPTNPTLYICAQDRGGSAAPPPGALERFEIIINAPAVPEARPCELEFDLCQSRTFHTLSRYGLTFDPMPQRDALMQPVDFAMRYPASLGALYGESPHGMTASLKRPRAKTAIPGLYLAGGGAHPGAGIPMAALSARHAVETILSDRTSHSRSLQTATHGGTSTA